MITIRIGNAVNLILSIYVHAFVALAVYTRSPAAYEALKSLQILQLPSRSLLQSYTSSFLHEPGANDSCIVDQLAAYMVFKEEMRRSRK